MTHIRRLIAVAACTGLAAAAVVGQTPADAAARRWAAASSARIHPGVQTRTSQGQCTSNFIFHDSKNVYIGQAAHCSSKGAPTDTNGCTTPVLPVGTRVTIQGASKSGWVVYNSWATMQKVKERSANACEGNDFALVVINPSDAARVNPTVPNWGGPNGYDRSSNLGDFVYQYGNSGTRQGISELSPQVGLSTVTTNGGWTHGYYTVSPGVPGDSGSAVLGPSGGALGAFVSSTLFYLEIPPSGIPPTPGTSNATDLYRAVAYMKKYTSYDNVYLANGTQRFVGVSGAL